MTDLDEIGDELTSSVNVHIVVTSLSPLKKGSSHRTLMVVIDGSTCRHVVAFTEMLDIFMGFKQGRRPVELKDCQVKHSSCGEEMIKPAARFFFLIRISTLAKLIRW